MRQETKAPLPFAIPWWLRKLDLVRLELRGMRFPRTAEEGLKQCAELSAACLGLVEEEARKTACTRDQGSLGSEIHCLMASFSRLDKKWQAKRDP